MDELPFWRLLRLYLDPLAFFKNIAVEPDAAAYNRRHRGILLTYMRRWAVIALVCFTGIARLAALARGEPLLWIPLAALEVGFSSGLCVSFLSIAAYVVLGFER